MITRLPHTGMNHSLATARFALSCLIHELIRTIRKAPR